MAIVAIVDTHSLIWYLDGDSRLSVTASSEFYKAERAGDTIGIATTTIVEMILLVEKGRLQPALLNDLQAALSAPPVVIEPVPLTPEIALAVQRIPGRAVNDPFDRIIAATALELGVPLITRDARITASSVVPTIW